MFDEFLKYSQNELNLKIKNRILLTVSGGADSVVMLDLFSKSNYQVGIAHCNFHLRGLDSDKDEALVLKLAEKYNYPFYKIDFDTKLYATDNGISIEMAARELRYKWFEKIRKQKHFDYIATAHHADDVIESFFINLTRGTGIRGLSGIKAKSGKIIRPLLFAEKNEILNYIKENKLVYCEDKSNSDIQIHRNKLRHDILPQLKNINSAYKKNIIRTIGHLYDTEKVLEDKLKEVRQNIVQEKNNQIIVNLKKLKDYKPVKLYLFELLNPYGFNAIQIEDIFKALNANSGKTFYSNNYRLIKDRNSIIIDQNDYQKFTKTIYTDSDSKIELENGKILFISKFNREKEFKIPKEHNIAAIDANLVSFPLTIRKWQKGDYFYPLGMQSKKKLSDFFIDQKLSIPEKEAALLMLSGNNIIWIIGQRLDNRFKITEKTKNILLLQFKYHFKEENKFKK